MIKYITIAYMNIIYRIKLNKTQYNIFLLGFYMDAPLLTEMAEPPE